MLLVICFCSLTLMLSYFGTSLVTGQRSNGSPVSAHFVAFGVSHVAGLRSSIGDADKLSRRRGESCALQVTNALL